MKIETIVIKRNDDGTLNTIKNSLYLEKLITEFENEKLPNRNKSHHYEAEISAGFEWLIEWIKK